MRSLLVMAGLRRLRRAQAASSGTGSILVATASSTLRSTASRSHNRVTIPAHTPTLERKRAEGKSRREAIRCLKRQLVRVVYNTLKTSPALT